MIAFDCPHCGEGMEIGEKMIGKKVPCVECGKDIVVPKKSAPVKPDLDRKDLIEIALRQKMILFCVLVYIGAIVSHFTVPKEYVEYIRYGVLAFGVLAAVLVFLLAQKLYEPGPGAALALVTLVPVIGLFTLLIINSKATNRLVSRGIRVGLMGARMSDFKKLKKDDY